MNIADKKVELIEWLARLQDHALLEKVEQLKQLILAYEFSAKKIRLERAGTLRAEYYEKKRIS
jgi:hypothetical protein